MLTSVKWPLLVYVVIYLGLVVMRNSQIKYSSKELAAAKKFCNDFDNRKVDISDSRLSNFDSDSSDRELDSSELLTIDRVIPPTRTLNQLMDKILRKFALIVTLEDKKILPLHNKNFNLTYNDDESEQRVFGRNAFLSRLDSLKRLGNAYIADDTDTTIIIVQKLQFKILKQSFDFYNANSSYLGGSSFIYNNNAFLLSIELSTSYDNSACRIRSVSFTFVPDKNSLKLQIEGLSGSESFFNKLKPVVYDNFITQVSPAVENELLPILRNLIYGANVCSYFDPKDKNSRNSTVVNPSEDNFTV